MSNWQMSKCGYYGSRWLCWCPGYCQKWPNRKAAIAATKKLYLTQQAKS